MTIENPFGSSEVLGLFYLKRLTTPFSIVKFNRGNLNYQCVYVFGIRIAYFTII